MPKAVIFGAGNIGRGFIGQIAAESGYEPVFIEANRGLVDALNARGEYPISLVSDASEAEFVVKGVRAVAADAPAAELELAGADLAATAVGVNALADVAGVIAGAMSLRIKIQPGRPLDIILCENLIHADSFLRARIARQLEPEVKAEALSRLGLVEASIGRMVPVVTPARRAADPLRVWVEPYCELPVDAAGFKGPIPKLAHLLPYQPFDYYIQRKLFLHNAGHSLAAYLGRLAGYTFIWEAMADPGISRCVTEGMTQSAYALAAEHGVNAADPLANAEDLRERFANQALGDTVARVGKDPLRKLGPADRLVGTAKLVAKHGGDPAALAKGIAAGLLFDGPDGEAAVRLHEILVTEGLDRTLSQVCGLAPDDPLAGMVRRHYTQLRGLKENRIMSATD